MQGQPWLGRLRSWDGPQRSPVLTRLFIDVYHVALAPTVSRVQGLVHVPESDQSNAAACLMCRIECQPQVCIPVISCLHASPTSHMAGFTDHRAGQHAAVQITIGKAS